MNSVKSKILEDLQYVALDYIQHNVNIRVRDYVHHNVNIRVRDSVSIFVELRNSIRPLKRAMIGHGRID